MAPKDKHYFVPTETGRYPQPVTEPGISLQLPCTLAVKKPAKVNFLISDDLPRWHKDGRVHEVLLRVRLMSVTERDRLRFRLNGKELPSGLLRKINQMYRMTAPRYRVTAPGPRRDRAVRRDLARLANSLRAIGLRAHQ